VPEEAQRRKSQLACLGPRAPAALHAHGIRRKGEADGRDAAEGRRRPAVGDQSVLPVHCFPEEAEGPLLNVLVEGRKGAADRRILDGGTGRDRASGGQERRNSKKRTGAEGG